MTDSAAVSKDHPLSVGSEASTPDYVYDTDEWETTLTADNLCELFDGCDDDKIIELGRLKSLPNTFAANVPIAWDDAGEPDDWEVQEFATHEEAKTAIKAKPPTLTGGAS